MDPSVAEYLASLGLPAEPGITPAAPAAPVAAPASGGSGGWETALRAALPALGAFLAGRSGSAGSFMTGYNQQEQIQRQNQELQRRIAADEQEAAIRKAQIEERRQIAQAQSEQRQRQEADRAAAAREKQEKDDLAGIQKSVDAASDNPLLSALVGAFGASGLSVRTPQGVMSLEEAQRRGAIVPGKLGHPTLPTAPKKEKPSLVDDYLADGSIRRVEDKPGLVRHGRPNAPKEPKEPKKPATYRYTWKDDDPASETYGQSFRVVEDEAGNIISKARVTAGTVAPTAAPAAPAGAPRKIGRFTVEVDN